MANIPSTDIKYSELASSSNVMVDVYKYIQQPFRASLALASGTVVGWNKMNLTYIEDGDLPTDKNAYTVSNNQVIINYAGYYLVSYTIMGRTDSGSWSTRTYNASTAYPVSQAYESGVLWTGARNWAQHNGLGVVYCNVGDKIEVDFHVSSDTTPSVFGHNYSSMSILKLSSNH